MNLGVATSIPFERKFDFFVFSSHISKIPEFNLNKETENRKKVRKRSIEKKKKGEKLQKSLSFEKRGIQYFERRKHFQNFSV
jgi:hypothetical protein